jgi:hypothetical protein
MPPGFIFETFPGFAFLVSRTLGSEDYLRTTDRRAYLAYGQPQLGSQLGAGAQQALDTQQQARRQAIRARILDSNPPPQQLLQEDAQGSQEASQPQLGSHPPPQPSLQPVEQAGADSQPQAGSAAQPLLQPVEQAGAASHPQAGSQQTGAQA